MKEVKGSAIAQENGDFFNDPAAERFL